MRLPILRFNRYIAFSIVASSVLCGQAYIGWNGGQFNDGDTVNISYGPTTTQTNIQILTQSINLASGTMTATIDVGTLQQGILQGGGFVGNFSGGTITFGSTGANLNFNITKGQYSLGADTAFAFNGTTFNAQANLNATMSGGGTLFQANGGSLNFQGDTTLQGNTVISTTGNTTLNINQNGNKKVDINGAINLNGGTSNIKLDNSNAKINGKITATNGTTKLELSNQGQMTGDFNGTGASTLNLTIDNATYNGNVNNSGASTITINNNGTLQGDLTTSGNSLTLSMGGGNITGSVTSTATTNQLVASKGGNTLGGLSFSGLNNTWNTSWGQNITINGNASFTASNGGKNTLTIQGGGGVNGTLTTNGDTNITSYSSTKFGQIIHSGESYTQELYSHSQVSNGIIIKDSTSVSIKAQDSDILGTSSIASSGQVSLTFENSAKGGDFELKGNTNTLTGTGNNTINSVSMTGASNTLTATKATNNNGSTTTGDLTITTNVTMNGDNNLKTTNGGVINIKGNVILDATPTHSNTVNLDNSKISGTLSTTGTTNIATTNQTNIEKIEHSNGKLTATLKSGSIINNGFLTQGKQDTANVTLSDNSQLKGNSSFDNATNQVTLNDTASVTGNIAFNETSSLTANSNTTIAGQISTNSGTATHTLSGSTTITGGIDTEAGATKTTANFSEDSKLQNGTSTFNSNIDIIFAENSKAINEKFNVAQGTANITFKDNAEMQGGSITNNGGNANIIFQDNSKMTSNSSINTENGITKLDAKNSANLTGTITQSGGDFNATFKDSSQFNGDATQSGGTSNITFQNQSKWTGNFNQSGSTSSSIIIFNNTANMQGNITTTNGTTDITFNPNTKIVGDIKAQGTTNKVTFDTARLEGNLTLDGLRDIVGDSQGDFTKSTVTGNIQGYDKVVLNLTETEVKGFLHQGSSANNLGITGIIIDSKIDGGFAGTDSNNSLEITHSQIDNAMTQSGGKLTSNATDTIINGGFSGTNNSANNINMTNGQLNGGITQNTGSLDFKSQGTNITGGFTGVNSTNTLKMANGDFNSEDIQQVLGSLNAEIISISKLGNFGGESSDNVIHLSSTEIGSVSQSAGSLELNTNSNVNDAITGTNGSKNKITIVGANAKGAISQSGGSMDLTLLNSNAQKDISSTNASFGLYATNATVEGNITLDQSTTNGVSENLTLKGAFIQTGGTSTITFANTTFKQSTAINNATSASMIFTKSHIQDIEATQGVTAFNLADSTMTDFTGNMGSHSVTLVKSIAQAFAQKGGGLTLNASNNSEVVSVAGSNFSNVAITLDRSKITGDVINNGETTIIMQDSEIGGNVVQTGTSISFTASNSTLKGQYKQTDGTSMVNFTDSKINGGIDVKTISNGTMNFTQNSQITGGVNTTDSKFTFMLLSGSKLDGGFTQDKNTITGTIDQSTLNGGLKLSDGTTNFSLHNNSTLNNGVTATNNNTTILVDNSQLNGDITINQGSLDLTAQNNSTITSNQMQVTNADLKLTLDTTSKFIGNLTQTNSKQEITIKQNSTFQGDITNNNTDSTIRVQNATLQGNLTQTNGTLGLDLSNKGVITGNVTVNNVTTTLSGSGANNAINGNFTQTNGSVSGPMNGLTLGGTYSQTGGTSSVTFTNSAFNNETKITNATNSSLTFDHSTLKGYTTDGGTNNTLKLLNNTTMSGTLALKNSAQTTLTMDSSTLNGDNDMAITATGNSFLTFNTLNSTITGAVNVNTGGLKGTADSTKFTGDFTLTDTTSDVSFINGSKITGNMTATDGNNTINFDASSITGNLSQTNGAINLDLSNGSSIGGDLIFTNTITNFTGSGAGNSIKGKFDSIRTQLTGDVSGIALIGTFTQENGTSNITFRNKSNFNGAVTVKDATSSNINFTNQSGINNTILITNGTKNAINLTDSSFIKGNTTITNATASITGSNNSSVIGDIQANTSNTTLSLTGSTLNGAITQNNGTLSVSGSNGSNLTSNMTLNDGSSTINLSNNSNLTGTITASNNPLTMTLNNNSSFNSMQAPQDIKITNADFTLTTSDSSTFGGNLTQTSDNGNHNANLTFNSNSYYSGTINLNNVTLTAKFNQSGIFSENISISGKSALFDFDGTTNGGVIQNLIVNGADLTINTTNQSHVTINNLQMNGNTLNLTASNNSRLSGYVTLNNATTATYTATSNGNLNVDTKIANQASTLTATINGGILQGSITQDSNGNGFSTGDVTLSNSGRWAVTGDSQVKSLTLNNTQETLFSDAIFASVFKSPLSFVDFTLEKEDTDTSSRVGKAIIRKPEPQPNQPIPEAGEGRTYVRQLQVNKISGDNGLFRVYADLGTNLADNILAQEANGNHLIQVQYRAETFREIGSDRIVVAKVTDPTTSVSFKGTQSEIGLTKYDTEIIKENAQDGNGFEWIIGQATPAGMSYSSKIVASILQSQYRTFMVEVDSLDRRLGDLEFIKRDKGFWIRSYVGQSTKEATDFSTFAKDDYYSIWSGFDYNSVGLTVHNYVGVFFNYTGINTQSKDYTGKSSNIALGIYNTFKANSGFYADLLAKYIYTMSDFDITNYSLAKNSPKIDNHKFLLNAEIGYSFYYGEKGKSGYVQPQFQVTSGYIHKTDLSVVDVSGETINATIGRNFPVSIRAGAFWGQVFGEKIKSHIKLGTSFVYDVNSGGDLAFQDSSSELHFKQGGDFRWVLSAQTDFTFSEFFKLYASIDTSFFGDYNTTYCANIGMRFIFGRSNNYVRNVPMVYNPYTPPVAINDDKRTVPVVKRYTTKDIDQNYAGKPKKVESYIQGNINPSIQQGSQTYMPTRQPHRDITDVVEFGEQQ